MKAPLSSPLHVNADHSAIPLSWHFKHKFKSIVRGWLWENHGLNNRNFVKTMKSLKTNAMVFGTFHGLDETIIL